MQRLEITTAVPCNTGCYYCPQGVLKKVYSGRHEMSLQEFKDFEKKLPRAVRLHFSGFCEPLQNKDASSMMEYAFQNGRDVVLYTNLLNLRTTDLWKMYNVHFYKFFIHLPNMQTKRDSVKKFIDNIRLLLDCKFHFEVIDISAPEEVLSMMRAFGIYPIKQTLIHRAGNLRKNERLYGRIYCVEGRENQHVLLPNGDIVLCCQDYGMKHNLGNLNLMTFNEIIYGREMNRVMEGFKDESADTLCRYCEKAANVTWG
jgi:radical SAM protein with 4Fe4S-binding SPASM domain